MSNERGHQFDKVWVDEFANMRKKLKFARAMMTLRAGQVITEGLRGGQVVLCPRLSFAAKPIGMLRVDVEKEEFILYDPDSNFNTRQVMAGDLRFEMAIDFATADADPRKLVAVMYIVNDKMEILGRVTHDPRGQSILYKYPNRVKFMEWSKKQEPMNDFRKMHKLWYQEYTPPEYLALALEVYIRYDEEADDNPNRNPHKSFTELVQQSYPEAVAKGFMDDRKAWSRCVREQAHNAEIEMRRRKGEHGPIQD